MQIGKYKVLRKLATGGMAEIFLARSASPEGFEKLLVLKKILPVHEENRGLVEMFLDEARIAATLNHPNIAQVYELGSQDGHYFLVMEYVHGEDLRRVCERGLQVDQFLPIGFACKAISEAAAGLHYAHTKTDSRGRSLHIVHRDVSPQNLLLTFDGDLKIVDFGIAKAANKMTTTQTGQLKGKFAYMSPEQVSGQSIDHRSDIFALGVVLYEITVVSRLFRAENDLKTIAQVARAIVPAPTKQRPDYPKELERIVLRALSRDPKKRFPSAQAMHDELESFIAKHMGNVSKAAIASYMRTLFPERMGAEQEDASAVLKAATPAIEVVPSLVLASPHPAEDDEDEATTRWSRDTIRREVEAPLAKQALGALGGFKSALTSDADGRSAQQLGADSGGNSAGTQGSQESHQQRGIGGSARQAESLNAGSAPKLQRAPVPDVFDPRTQDPPTERSLQALQPSHHPLLRPSPVPAHLPEWPESTIENASVPSPSALEAAAPVSQAIIASTSASHERKPIQAKVSKEPASSSHSKGMLADAKSVDAEAEPAKRLADALNARAPAPLLSVSSQGPTRRLPAQGGSELSHRPAPLVQPGSFAQSRPPGRTGEELTRRVSAVFSQAPAQSPHPPPSRASGARFSPVEVLPSSSGTKTEGGPALMSEQGKKAESDNLAQRAIGSLESLGSLTSLNDSRLPGVSPKQPAEDALSSLDDLRESPPPLQSPMVGSSSPRPKSSVAASDPLDFGEFPVPASIPNAPQAGPAQLISANAPGASEGFNSNPFIEAQKASHDENGVPVLPDLPSPQREILQPSVQAQFAASAPAPAQARLDPEEVEMMELDVKARKQRSRLLIVIGIATVFMVGAVLVYVFGFSGYGRFVTRDLEEEPDPEKGPPTWVELPLQAIEIRTEPPGAYLSLNAGPVVGRSPMKLDFVQNKANTVAIYLEGHKPLHAFLPIGTDLSRGLDYQLEAIVEPPPPPPPPPPEEAAPEEGEELAPPPPPPPSIWTKLEVRTQKPEDDGAKVVLDGVEVGTTPVVIEKVLKGSYHHVLVDKAGKAPHVILFRPLQDLYLITALLNDGVYLDRKADIKIEPGPRDAVVSFDGQATPGLATMVFEKGQLVHVSATKDGYDPWQYTIHTTHAGVFQLEPVLSAPRNDPAAVTWVSPPKTYWYACLKSKTASKCWDDANSRGQKELPAGTYEVRVWEQLGGSASNRRNAPNTPVITLEPHLAYTFDLDFSGEEVKLTQTEAVPYVPGQAEEEEKKDGKDKKDKKDKKKKKGR
ncbi:MAG: protein kinase [Myxococcota bacterium]|jgi:serine/threonine protein kinase|nr:protein kinase [Myxococcota bacterium]